jgi:hypothetical protein
LPARHATYAEPPAIAMPLGDAAVVGDQVVIGLTNDAAALPSTTGQP